MALRLPNIVGILVFLQILLLGGCAMDQNRSSVVEIHTHDGGYHLIKNGEPYTIYGVGGTTNLALLKQYGGNTIRTWDAEGIEPLMDEAHELGLSVVVGIWLEHARHDFDYNKQGAKQQQLDRVERFVRQYRDHPALLAWGVGNEVEIGGTMDGAIQQINDAAELIKTLDTDHPTMAILAEIGKDKAIRIEDECPNIDILGINSYGGLGNLTKRLEIQGVTIPYVVTEFGPLGHWESGYAPWGAPYEMSSSAKAEFLRNNYTKSITPNLGKQCLGSFAFLWGNKQEKTSTWYGLLLESGETIESVDVLHELWTGQQVKNAAPKVESLQTEANLHALQPNQQIEIGVQASDPDGDPMSVQWQVVSESTVESMGGDFEEKIEPVQVDIQQLDALSCRITMPSEAGAYRIFATVRDGQGHAGTANVPVLIVED